MDVAVALKERGPIDDDDASDDKSSGSFRRAAFMPDPPSARKSVAVIMVSLPPLRITEGTSTATVAARSTPPGARSKIFKEPSR